MNKMMTDTATTQAVVVEETFAHAPAPIWRLLTDGSLIGRWFMAPQGFAPVVGTDFTFQTTPAGAWDGTIHCQVLEVVAEQRLSYSWKGGHADNLGYGSLLDTTVTWLLTPVSGGTRLRLVHDGFIVPRNDVAYQNMGKGWQTVVARLADAADKPD